MRFTIILFPSAKGVSWGPEKLLRTKYVHILYCSDCRSFAFFGRYFHLQITLSQYRFREAGILLFLELKAEILRCAQRLQGTDGGGVQEVAPQVAPRCLPPLAEMTSGEVQPLH